MMRQRCMVWWVCGVLWALSGCRSEPAPPPSPEPVVQVSQRVDDEAWLSLNQTQIRTPDRDSTDGLGYTSAEHRDMLLLGARTEDIGPLRDNGAVYAFGRPQGGDYEVMHTITHDDAGNNDYFGSAMDIAGDRLVVSAPAKDDDQGVSNTGAVYLFDFTEVDGWSQSQKVESPVPASGGQFGRAVAMSAQYLVVSQSNQRAVFVYEESNGVWSLAQTVSLPPEVSAQNFGVSVTLSGDRMAVGAPDFEGGSVFVFTREGGAWGLTNTVRSQDVMPNDRFGISVSLEGTTLAVGASGESDDGLNSNGAAYVFQYDGQSWNQQQKVFAPDRDNAEAFGTTMKLEGERLLVSSSYNAYLYTYSLEQEAWSAGRGVNRRGNAGYASVTFYGDAAVFAYSRYGWIYFLANNSAPELELPDDLETMHRQPVSFTVSAVDCDQDEVTLEAYVQSGSFEITDIARNGERTTWSITYTPSDDYVERDVFTLRAQDLYSGDRQDSEYDYLYIDIMPNMSPTLTNAGDWVSEGLEGQAVAFQFEASDAEGDPITWESDFFGCPGMALSSQGLFSWTPAMGDQSCSFGFRLCDGVSNCSYYEFSMDVEAVNRAPSAFMLRLSGQEDTLLPLTLRGEDPEGSPLSLSVVQVEGGEVEVGESFRNGNQTLWLARFVPTQDFAGQASVRYTVSDGELSSQEAVVVIDVASVNDAPVAVDDRYQVAANTVLTVSALEGLRSNDSDPDHARDALTVLLAEAVSVGDLVLSFDGSFVYTPPVDFVGAAFFRYTLGDGEDSSASVPVLIEVTGQVSPDNAAPVMVDPAPLMGEEGRAFEVQLEASDPDGDRLSFSARGLPVGAFVSASGLFSWTPQPGQAGRYAVAVEVSDGELRDSSVLLMEVVGLDRDDDGVVDAQDNCPDVPNAVQVDTDSDDTGDACDVDDDGDGVLDGFDNCVLVANFGQADTDEDGEGDACDEDRDGDGVLDDQDNCVLVANEDQRDTDDDGIGDVCEDDSDGDGVPDDQDNCVLTRNEAQIDTNEDAEGDACDVDDDGDGVLDGFDNCVLVANFIQDDLEGDGQGDACDLDDDNDDVVDDEDNCPRLFNPMQEDSDGDGVGNLCQGDFDGDGVPDEEDNCVAVPNPSQDDFDEDGQGDVCDEDDDQDGIVDEVDNCVLTPNFLQEDLDQDGLGDACDDDNGDRDDDNILDEQDNCPDVPNTDQSDLDQDGLGDVCDEDMDGDGVGNEEDVCPVVEDMLQVDTDLDGVGDLCSDDDDGDGISDREDNCVLVINPAQVDTDNDGLGDACEQDRDGDGVLDDDDNCPEASNPEQRDSDLDGLGDVCDSSPRPDEDGDGVSDFEDNCLSVANEDQADLDGDGQGDACDDDDDKDGIVDLEDNCPGLSNADQLDTDGDGVGDLCDETPFEDVDGDGVADDQDNCPEVSNAAQADEDGDGQGDACEDSTEPDPIEPEPMDPEEEEGVVISTTTQGGGGCSTTPVVPKRPSVWLWGVLGLVLGVRFRLKR